MILSLIIAFLAGICFSCGLLFMPPRRRPPMVPPKDPPPPSVDQVPLPPSFPAQTPITFGSGTIVSSGTTVHLSGGSISFSGSGGGGSAGSSGSGGGGGSAGSGGSTSSGTGRYVKGGIVLRGSMGGTGSVSGGKNVSGDRPKYAGMPGFDGMGSFELAPGRVFGVRGWTLNSAPLYESPALSNWQPQLLRGRTGFSWEPGVNEAVCNYDRTHLPPIDFNANGEPCGCGFWGYWKLPPGFRSQHGRLEIEGVIEGTGRTVIGERGFRCQQARIIALAPSFTIDTKVTGQHSRSDIDQQLIEARDRANAWLGHIQVRLGAMYPQAQVFATVNGMLAAFPPGEKYT